MWGTSAERLFSVKHLSRAKNLFPLPCRLDVLKRGLAHCLCAHSFSLRDNIGKKLAYAELMRQEMLRNDTPTTGFAYASAWTCLHQRHMGASLAPLQIASPKRLLFGRVCGLLLEKSTPAYALLTRSLRGISPWCCLTMTIVEKIENIRENREGNHSWGNHWSNTTCCDRCTLCLMSWFPYISKSPSETKPKLESLLLICTYHTYTCAYAQCVRSTFLTRPLRPPYADQGFAYAKCSDDRALINSKRFLGSLTCSRTRKEDGKAVNHTISRTSTASRVWERPSLYSHRPNMKNTPQTKPWFVGNFHIPLGP